MNGSKERSARGATVEAGEDNAKRAKMMQEEESEHAADQAGTGAASGPSLEEELGAKGFSSEPPLNDGTVYEVAETPDSFNLGAATPLQPHADKAELPEPKHVDSSRGFRGLREPNAFWYDNTHALFHLLSKSDVIGKTLLTRPPRMGKTIFCEMLGTYVDCKTPEAVFEQCFRDTYIVRAEDDMRISMNHKASLLALKRKCCWLPLTIKNQLHDTISSTNKQVKTFARKYGLEVEINESCTSSVENAIQAATEAQIPIVITMDEYDRLARSNRDGKEAEIALMRDLFTVFKDAAPRFLFVTGIMPLLATELSGAANDVVVITHDSEFADAVGLPQDVVANELCRIAAYHERCKGLG